VLHSLTNDKTQYTFSIHATIKLGACKSSADESVNKKPVTGAGSD